MSVLHREAWSMVLWAASTRARLRSGRHQPAHLPPADRTCGSKVIPVPRVGLATSHKDEQGFTWDIGGHVQFSHYRYFDHLMDLAMGSRWLDHERDSWVWMEGRFIPYPFQNNLRYLRPETTWKCLQGLIRLYKQPFQGKPANFREWIDATFGAGLAEVFMVPYNFKVWA